jgi:hypothetical protein
MGLCVIGAVAAARRWREPGPGLLAAMIWPGVALFVQHALGDRVQGNWPAVIYPAAVIAALLAGARWRTAGTLLGLGLGVLVLAQFALGLVRLPGNWGELLVRPGMAQQFAKSVAGAAGNEAFVASDDYGDASLLAWYLPAQTPVVAIGNRWKEFDLPSAAALLVRAPGMLVVRQRTPPDAVDPAKTLLEKVAGVRGKQAEMLYQWQAPLTGASIKAAILPHRKNFAAG